MGRRRHADLTGEKHAVQAINVCSNTREAAGRVLFSGLCEGFGQTRAAPPPLQTENSVTSATSLLTCRGWRRAQLLEKKN